MHKHELRLLSKYCGISWCPGGFASDAYVRELSDIPRLMYWDHMHILSASGGIGHFTLNACAVKLAQPDVVPIGFGLLAGGRRFA